MVYDINYNLQYKMVLQQNSDSQSCFLNKHSVHPIWSHMWLLSSVYNQGYDG